MALCLSRNSEWRADAAAVSYCRDPLALAAALSIASRSWRGGGDLTDSYEQLFILPPTNVPTALPFFSGIFSTHPPVEQRVERLLEMGHADQAALSAMIAETSVPQKVVSEIVSDAPLRWHVYGDQGWSLPLTMGEVVAMGLSCDAFVRREGSDKIIAVSDDQTLLSAFRGDIDTQAALCPRCFVPLTTAHYEGAEITTCAKCGGVLVPNQAIDTFILRRDGAFSPEVVAAAEKILADANRQYIADTPFFSHNARCPRCGKMMYSRFHTAMDRIEIDVCDDCGVTWFDKDELHIIEYIAEKGDTLTA